MLTIANGNSLVNVSCLDARTGHVHWYTQDADTTTRRYNMIMSPNGKFTLSAESYMHYTGRSTVDRWILSDTQTGEDVMVGKNIRNDPKKNPVYMKLAFSPCSRFFATGDHRGDVSIYDANTGLVEIEMETPENCSIISLSFSCDSLRLASSIRQTNKIGYFTDVIIWNRLTGTTFDQLSCGYLKRMRAPKKNVIQDVQFSPVNPNRLAIVSRVVTSTPQNSIIDILDIKLKERKQTFLGGNFIAWSPDGKKIVSSYPIGQEGVLCVNSTKTGEKICEFQTRDCVRTTAWFTDNGHIMSGGHKNCNLWDASTGKLIQKIQTGYYCQIAWTPHEPEIEYDVDVNTSWLEKVAHHSSEASKEDGFPRLNDMEAYDQNIFSLFDELEELCVLRIM